jgi:hypothetical protein
VHWRGSGDSSFGGKMLKIILGLVLLFNMNSLFACWKIEGSFAVDGETWRIHHKFEDHEEFFLTAHEFILSLSLIKKEDQTLRLRYKINHKKGSTLSLVSKGEEELKEEKNQDIYIKGDKGYPHSIITVKLKNI